MQPGGYGFSSNWAAGLSALALWTFVGIFFATTGGDLRSVLISWYVWGVFAWLIGILDRQLPVPHDRLAPRLLWHIPLSLVTCLLYACVMITVNGLLAGHAPGGGWFRKVAEDVKGGAIQWNIPIYWLILGAHLALGYRHESQRRKQRESELELMLSEARMSALRAQLNPHFLFNTLNTISAYVESEPRLARNMLGHLGGLLRMSLDQAGKQEVTLAEEIDFLEHYLAIQRVRFGSRLQVEVNVDPRLSGCSVPSLILQPLAENAITHGLATKEGVGRLSIDVRQNGAGSLHIVMRDNGVGLPADWDWERNAGLGLTTTRSRLAALYGDDQSLTIRDMGDGVMVEVVLNGRDVAERACIDR